MSGRSGEFFLSLFFLVGKSVFFFRVGKSVSFFVSGQSGERATLSWPRPCGSAGPGKAARSGEPGDGGHLSGLQGQTGCPNREARQTHRIVAVSRESCRAVQGAVSGDVSSSQGLIFRKMAPPQIGVWF